MLEMVQNYKRSIGDASATAPTGYFPSLRVVPGLAKKIFHSYRSSCCDILTLFMGHTKDFCACSSDPNFKMKFEISEGDVQGADAWINHSDNVAGELGLGLLLSQVLTLVAFLSCSDGLGKFERGRPAHAITGTGHGERGEEEAGHKG